MEESAKREIVNFFIKNGVLLDPEFLNSVDCLNTEQCTALLQKIKSPEFLMLSEDVSNLLTKDGKLNVDWIELDYAKTLYEKGINKENYLSMVQPESVSSMNSGGVNILFSYREKSKKRTVQDFVAYFNARYSAIEKLLKNRHELQGIMSISRISKKTDKEEVALIGMVKEKNATPNGNYMLEIEDATGTIKVLISKNRKELYDFAEEIVQDEVLGIVGTSGNNIVFANNIICPDVPLSKELKKSPDEAYAIFLSDIHVGSNKFLGDEFNQFLQWINGNIGNEQQRQIPAKVKYIFIAGDLIDGLGIYPGQEADLKINDIMQQYDECARLLRKIPSRIKLIICPGNHDAMRIAEPQPELFKDFAKSLWEMPNVIMVSNPSLINIHSSENFPGFDILMYHGYSFDHFIANVTPIRNNGGYDRADLVMKFLLQKRHLAPTHRATLYIPETTKDPLVIDKVPDFFATGHIHKSCVANYRNVTMICGSCWQAKTAFQEKVGHNPEPARVPIVNLQTREVKILKFVK